MITLISFHPADPFCPTMLGRDPLLYGAGSLNGLHDPIRVPIED